MPYPRAELAPTNCPTIELDPPAPSTNSTLDTIVFSSTIIPQSVQTDEPLGPRDSMLGELQFGQWNVDDAAAVVVAVGASIEVGGGADFFCDVSSSSPIVPTTSLMMLQQ